MTKQEIDKFADEYIALLNGKSAEGDLGDAFIRLEEAKRIYMKEKRDKIRKELNKGNELNNQIVRALVSLGYTKTQVEETLPLCKSVKTVEDAIKLILSRGVKT